MNNNIFPFIPNHPLFCLACYATKYNLIYNSNTTTVQIFNIGLLNTYRPLLLPEGLKQNSGCMRPKKASLRTPVQYILDTVIMDIVNVSLSIILIYVYTIQNLLDILM